MKIALELGVDGRENMARDAALLHEAEVGWASARVYTWDGPWVSLGMFQSPQKDLRPGCPVPWVVRPTGGKAVLHGHDVTLGAAWPLTWVRDRLLARREPVPPSLSRSVRSVYRIAAGPILASLRACGIPAALGEATRFAGRGPRTADCFAHVSANDIVDERTGVKVCGCALRITDAAVLVQASIPAGPPLVDPAAVYERPAVSTAAKLAPDAFAEALEKAISAWI
ncbi:MAG: hypothetical protein SNJ61_00575 [Fimbriimonadaceae bacterium]